MTELRLARPDDGHLHLRDGELLRAVLPDTARSFGRAVVMPNLTPPVRSVADAAAYRDRIVGAMEGLNRQFEPLLTLYLTDQTSEDDIRTATAAISVPFHLIFMALSTEPRTV